MPKPITRSKQKDNVRRSRRKVSILTQERVEYVDWKDVNLLRRFMSDRAKIRSRRVTGNDTQQQAEIARAIKNAREMALLPYASRVTQVRGQRRQDGERGDRASRSRDGETTSERSQSAEDGADVLANEPPEIESTEGQ